MRWKGVADFEGKVKRRLEQTRVEAARACYEAGKMQRDRALENFTTFGIGMITGRSRALYAVQPGEGMFTPGATKVSYEVGYTSWPSGGDRQSGGQPVPFYPLWLDHGTNRMPARPYHTAALNATYPEFRRRMREILRRASR